MADHIRCPPEDFKTCVRGGTRQQKQKGVVVDHVQASAATPLASEWVEMYGMQKTASFSIHVYGERGAAELSLLWCRRMQFFYDRELQIVELWSTSTMPMMWPMLHV